MNAPSGRLHERASWKPYDLGLIMPIYNEAQSIEATVQRWHVALDGLGAQYRLYLLDDGSTDGTGAILDRLAQLSRIELVHKSNTGHGPTIFAGYLMATNHCEWVFQCDGDDELGPEFLATFWNHRHDHDLIIGCRKGRRQSLLRKLFTVGAGTLVRCLFGSGIRDVNVPYRLMSGDILQRQLPCLGKSPVVPNILLSALSCRAGLRILELPVHFHAVAGRTSSIGGSKALPFAFRAFREIIRVSLGCPLS